MHRDSGTLPTNAKTLASAKTLAERIRRDLAQFTVSEKRAAKSCCTITHSRASEPSRNSRPGPASAPSVLRFVTRLGFGGFPEFQKHLREELEAQLKSPLMKADSGEVGVAGASEFASFAGAVIENMRATVESVPPTEFEALVALLSDPRRRIHFAGGRFTDALARYAERHFRIVRADNGNLDGQPSLWRDRMVEIGRARCAGRSGHKPLSARRDCASPKPPPSRARQSCS